MLLYLLKDICPIEVVHSKTETDESENTLDEP